MAFPGLNPTASDVPGIVVPCPVLDTAYWLRGVDAPVTSPFIVSEDLPITVRTVPEESGSAKCEAVVNPSTRLAAAQVQISLEGVWDVVTVDNFDDNLCDDTIAADPLGVGVRMFLGRADSGSLVRLNKGPTEISDVVQAFLRPNVIAPNGIGSRCIFEEVYVAVQTVTGGIMTVTPVIDGEVLSASAVTFAIPATGSDRTPHRFKVPLVQAGSFNTYGILGTWFTVEIEVADVFGCGHLDVAGIELVYSPAGDLDPGQVFTGESLAVPFSEESKKWYVGTDSGKVLRGGVGTDDGGGAVAVRAQTNAVAPAGEAGEVMFRGVFIAVTRFNANPWTIHVTPVVDGVDMTTQDYTFAGVANPVSEVVQVNFEEIGWSTWCPRGAWISVRITAGSAPDREVVIEGIELEHEVVTESLEAADA